MSRNIVTVVLSDRNFAKPLNGLKSWLYCELFVCLFWVFWVFFPLRGEKMISFLLQYNGTDVMWVEGLSPFIFKTVARVFKPLLFSPVSC